MFENKQYKKCVYHADFSQMKVPHCLPPDSDKAIRVECEICPHFIDFKDEKTLSTVSQAIQLGYYAPMSELPDVSNLAILFMNTTLELERKKKHQEIMFSHYCKTEIEIEQRVEQICEQNKIDYTSEANVTANVTILQLLEQAIKDADVKTSGSIQKLKEVQTALTERIIQTSDLKRIQELRKSLGPSLEEHAEEASLMYIFWKMCRKLDDLDSLYWTKQEDMVNHLSGKQLDMIIRVIKKMQRWRNVDFFHRSSRAIQAG